MGDRDLLVPHLVNLEPGSREHHVLMILVSNYCEFNVVFILKFSVSFGERIIERFALSSPFLDLGRLCPSSLKDSLHYLLCRFKNS